MLTASAPAKVNLALVVGPLRPNGKHEVATVVEKLALADTVTVDRADALRVVGFDDDTLVRAALGALAVRAGVEPEFAATIEKRVPVAAGLAGGSSDAAAALRLGNALLSQPLPDGDLHELAAGLGADVPLFLRRGAVLATADGTVLETLRLPCDYHVVVWLPHGQEKTSTASVYRSFDARHGAVGFDERREALLDALAEIGTAADLARLPPNDLARSPRARELIGLGAFRADVSGAGPALYGLFHDAGEASAAAQELGAEGRVWVTAPACDG